MNWKIDLFIFQNTNSVNRGNVSLTLSLSIYNPKNGFHFSISYQKICSVWLKEKNDTFSHI